MAHRVSLTISQAAHLAGVSRRTIHYWLQRGLVEGFRVPSGNRRIYEDSLVRPIETPPRDTRSDHDL